MFKFIALLGLLASANAGLIASPGLLAPGLSLAAGPALPATLLGRTEITAPETTIVKQQVVVDQPEIRLRAVPTVVQTAPVVAPAPVAVARTIAGPQVLAAPALRTIAAPAIAAPAIQTIAPQLLASPQLVQGNTIQTIATPFAAQSQLIAGVQSQTLLATPTSPLLASPLLLKK